ncbi:hypothetical protein [Streptomyces antarcticus]|uniref:hypothetical protein n=1 Tax=Streptomyces antarcticus TaxID=2996458 RepID=UPI0022703FDD|nr:MULTISPECIES: hypothetical protein [unclassified Streptomyces]MCY0940939.1 hypothetical protein [Streptomyces sp. H34-AA3]MCZ4087922.1 hypothetical protein [Streptomyces sp. H34-S5]
MEAGGGSGHPQDPESERVAEAGKRLRALLAGRRAYRARWLAHTQRRRGDDVSYSGIAQVVALYLWESGLRADTDQALPRKLRDRVRQALLGRQLTHETIAWIAESFEFTSEDVAEVWDAFSGHSAVDLGGNGVSFTLRGAPVALVRPQGHRTTALFSRYYVSADRALRRIETSHVLAAVNDGLEGFAYSPRDTVTGVESVVGGTFIGFRPSSPGYVGAEFRLHRRLSAGEHSSLQYTTLHRPASDPCVHVRRAARKRIDNVDMRVVFEAARPRTAWWCVWDAYSGSEPVRAIGIDVSPEGELHQFFPYLEQTVVGFQWRW